MSRIKKKPTYLLHKSSGQARVRVDGKDHYLGEYGSQESKDRYDRIVAEWFAKQGDTSAFRLTVDDLCLLFQDWASQHYLKNGEPTSEAYNIRLAMRYVVAKAGTMRAQEFGPKTLKVVRQAMIDAGCVRTSINRMVARIRRMFKWSVAEELIPVTVYQALCTVPGLEAGRSRAIESEPVKPVAQEIVDAVKPFVSRQVWAMIQLQILTGARPGEVVSMRGTDLTMTGKVWEYTPVSHKTQHRGRERVIFLGPRAQMIVRQFLKPNLAAHLFSPADAKIEHFADLRTKRKTPMTPSQRNRTPKAKPEKSPGERYTVTSYGRAIRNACRKADRQAHEDQPTKPADRVLVPDWHPHQLRHSSATELRRQFGIESARVILGHSSAVTTELYAEADRKKAKEIIGQVG